MATTIEAGRPWTTDYPTPTNSIARKALEAAMSIPLTREQWQAVQQSKEPLRFLDPDSMQEYILLPAELYERMRRMAQAEAVDPSFYEIGGTGESILSMFILRKLPFRDSAS